MRKLEALRDLLVRTVPSLKDDPAKLAVFADQGKVSAKPGSLSFEYRYTANLVVEELAGDVDRVIVPILGWIAQHQPELMQRQDGEPFGFEAETLAKDLIDLSITIDLTERVEVRRGMVGGKPGTIMTHLEDLLPPDTFPGAEDARLWIGIADDLVGGTAMPVIGRE